MTYKITIGDKIIYSGLTEQEGKEYARLKKVIKKGEEEKQKIMKGNSKLSDQGCLLNSLSLQQARLKRNELLQKRLEKIK